MPCSADERLPLYQLGFLVRPSGTVVPEYQMDLCFTADVFISFHLFHHRISKLPRPIAMKLMPHDWYLGCTL